MFCKYCGKKLDDKIFEEKQVVYCTACGKANRKAETEKKNDVKELKDIKIDESVSEARVYSRDSGSVGWGVLGFFFPIVGLILYLCWMRTSPRSANSAGAGALIAVVLMVLIALVFAILALFTNVRLPAEFFY